MNDVHVLDLSREPAGTAQLAAIAAVRELPRGAILVLLSAEDPGLLMRSLNVYFRDDLAWKAGEEAPGRWRCEVRHRDDVAAADVVDLLTRDHKRLDELFARALHLANAGDMAQAAPLLGEFGTGIRRHVEAENEVLVPVLGLPQSPAGDDPTSIMLREHEELLSQLGLIEFYFADGLPAAGEVAPFFAILSGTLAKHEYREETLLFPHWAARIRAMPEAARGDLQARVAAVLAGR